MNNFVFVKNAKDYFKGIFINSGSITFVMADKEAESLEARLKLGLTAAHYVLWTRGMQNEGLTKKRHGTLSSGELRAGKNLFLRGAEKKLMQ